MLQGILGLAIRYKAECPTVFFSIFNSSVPKLGEMCHYNNVNRIILLLTGKLRFWVYEVGDIMNRCDYSICCKIKPFKE